MSTEPLSLDPVQCRIRQQRLCSRMSELSVDAVIVTSHENVQYLTGFRPHRLMHTAVGLTADGTCTLVAPNSEPDNVAADQILTFEAQWHATLRQEQPQVATEALASQLPLTSARLGVEYSAAAAQVRQAFSLTSQQLVNVEPTLWQLRRHKDSDEVAMIRRAIDCTEAMYSRAREIITPGITELQVFNELQAAAVDIAGEPLTALGNDFQCNSPGGPPRARAAKEGELFILDLGPCYRGYYADNCRTIAVSGQPTDGQQQAWEAVVSVLEMVEQEVRPGVSCRSIFERAQQMLDAHRSDAFTHHLGHGFGLYPHTAPHLNPHWDDHFEEGDTFTAEPGLYADDLNAGIRLEQNYLVKSDGVERLTNFSLQM